MGDFFTAAWRLMSLVVSKVKNVFLPPPPPPQHTHIHIHTRIHTRTHVHTRMHTHTHTHTHAQNTHTHTKHTHTHGRTHTRIYKYAHTQIHTHTLLTGFWGWPDWTPAHSSVQTTPIAGQCLCKTQKYLMRLFFFVRRQMCEFCLCLMRKLINNFSCQNGKHELKQCFINGVVLFLL